MLKHVIDNLNGKLAELRYTADSLLSTTNKQKYLRLNLTKINTDTLSFWETFINARLQVLKILRF